MPGRVVVRQMREADIDEVSAIRLAGWRAAYPGLVPRSYLDRLTVEDDARRRRETFVEHQATVDNLVAEDGDVLVGWAAFGPSRETDRLDDDGELFALYVLPDRIGTGVGRVLLERVVERVVARSFGALSLWVLTGNGHARRFYERAGFTVDGGTQSWTADGARVPEVRYRRDLRQ